MICVSEAQWDSRTSGTQGGRGEFYECGDVFEDARAAQTSDGSTRRPKTCDEQSTWSSCAAYLEKADLLPSSLAIPGLYTRIADGG